MPSLKQTEANRLNSRKSTGPRSVEGKAASSMNALKSGIDAKSQILPDERRASLEALIAEYYLRFHPTTPEQRMYVDILIDSEWLLRRFRTAEAELWQNGYRPIYKDNQDVLLGIAAARHSDAFARLQRRIDLTQRNYRNALKDLQQLQAANPEPEPDPEPDPAPQPDPPTPRKEPFTPSNGFVPQPAPVILNPSPNSPIDTPPPYPVKI